MVSTILNGSCVEPRQDGADALGHRLAEGVVDVHEHRGARHRVGGLEEVADQREAVAHQVGRGREVAEHELVALLGDLRRGGDVDDERHAALLGDLRDRRGVRPSRTAPTSTLRAFLDQALGARARDVDVGLGVGVHQLDVDAEHLA